MEKLLRGLPTYTYLDLQGPFEGAGMSIRPNLVKPSTY